MSPELHLGSLGLAVLAYCAVHSWLASQTVKSWFGARWPVLMPAYRLLYNLLAVLLLLPLALLLWNWPGDTLWQRPFALRWLFDGVALLAIGAFVHSLRDYDLGLFSGSRQWRGRGKLADGEEPFRIGFWHRFVRHPWYFFALLILWTRDMDAAQLLFYTLVSGYLVVGSRLEERKLMAQYGEPYRRYCARVPGLVPLPWRWLSATEADELRGSQ